MNFLQNWSKVSFYYNAWKVFVFWVFLVRIFPHSDWIRKDTSDLALFSPKAGKYGPEKLRIKPVWLNGLVFIYELNGCEFESSCSHLNFRFHACFKQGVPWHSGNYRVWIHSEMRTRHDNDTQMNFVFFVFCPKLKSVLGILHFPLLWKLKYSKIFFWFCPTLNSYFLYAKIFFEFCRRYPTFPALYRTLKNNLKIVFDVLNNNFSNTQLPFHFLLQKGFGACLGSFEEQEMKKMRPIKKISVIGYLNKLWWGKMRR